MDFNNSFSSRRFYEGSNGSPLNSSTRFNGKTFNESHNDSFRTVNESQMNFKIEESVRNNAEIQRRSTITGLDSPFTTRRRIMLQSTPLANRRIGERVAPNPNFDVSTITTANENEGNQQRAVEDRNCVPHFFGAAAFIEKPKLQKDDKYISKLIDSDANSSFKSAPSRTLFSPSCSRSNTFASRKDGSGREARFSPYPLKNEKESRLSKGGPPLRSLNDSLPAIKRKADETSPEKKPAPSIEERDFWVTVFGFDKQKGAQSVIDLFSRHGQVVKTATPTTDGNWIHLRYATKVHAEQALQRNGELVDNYFIGVIHSSNVPYGCDSGDWDVATPSIRNPVADKSPNNVSFSSPQTSNHFIPGMRSLAVPSPNASNTPSKASSLINFLFKGKSGE